MQDIFYDPIPNADAYLKRIGCEDFTAPDLENLNRLIWCHQTSVPFESLDLSLWHHPISLTTEHLFEKVVEHRRGGYCFELNGLFVCLLRSLGYDAFSVHCRLGDGRPCVHRGTVVRLDGKRYFMDVGKGGGMAPFAVELSDRRQTLHGETYWIEEKAEGWRELKRLHESTGEETSVLCFMPMAFLNADFQTGNLMCSAPDFRFATQYIVNQRTPDGHISLNGTTLSVKSGSTLTETEIDPADIEQMLWEKFGLKNCEYVNP
ncbi:MAG: arylamine N-acetyltransferase [Clostridiales bacterium]|nr:arylamine N-acetyltransferase [Candidatus Apopatocola equi]